jgi:hypothetical protein
LSKSYRLEDRLLWQEHILSGGALPLLSRLLELKTHWWNNLVLHDLAVAGDAVSSSNGEHGLSIDLQEGSKEIQSINDEIMWENLEDAFDRAILGCRLGSLLDGPSLERHRFVRDPEGLCSYPHPMK